MNEQEMMQRKKIEKREKTDTILAYILIVILLGCIFVVLYLKFIRKEEEVNPNEEVTASSTINLDIISNGFNNSDLVSRYSADNKTINSTISGNALVITYEDGTDTKNYNIPLVNDELMFSVTENDNVIVDIYKEIAYIICAYSNAGNDACRSTANSLSEGTNGIRFEKTEDNNNVYVSITNSIVSGEENNNENGNVYNSETIVTLNDNNYTLNINDAIIKDIIVNTSDNGIKISGNVTSDNNVKVIVRLYDADKNVINEKTSENITSDFEIEFSEIENINEVISYSINIEK